MRQDHPDKLGGEVTVGTIPGEREEVLEGSGLRHFKKDIKISREQNMGEEGIGVCNNRR